MISISTHEHKGRFIIIERRSGEGTKMSDSMARSVKKIKGSIAEKVISVEAIDLKFVSKDTSLNTQFSASLSSTIASSRRGQPAQEVAQAPEPTTSSMICGN